MVIINVHVPENKEREVFSFTVPGQCLDMACKTCSRLGVLKRIT